MSTDRNGDDRLSGEARRREATPPLGAPSGPSPATDFDDPSALDRTAERIGAALRQQRVDDSAEQAAVAAFRSARSAGDSALRTRRRDDWCPPTRKQHWARGGAIAVVASMLLGGIAFASIGVLDTRRHNTPDPGTSHSTPRPPTSPVHTPRERTAPPAEPSTAPTTHSAPGHSGTAKNIKAHCRAYDKIKNRGHALDATAWQRLVEAAGGEQHVAAYCAQLTDSAHSAASSSPTKANKSGKGHGNPTARAKPSKTKGPSGQR